MAKHHSPKTKREVLTRLSQVLQDENVGVACGIVGEEFDISPVVINKWRTGQHLNKLSEIVPPVVPPAKVEFSNEVTTEVFLSDVHWHPEPRQGHDEAAYEATVQMLEKIQPDILFFGGDILDCYAPSRYLKEPRLATPQAFDAEIEWGKMELRRLRKILPHARMIWLTGNHELRLPKSVITNAPWLAGKIGDVESMLELSAFNIEVVEDGYRIGKLRHYHGHNLAGAGRVNTAKNKFERMLTNLIYGHHHKFAKWYQRDQDGSYFGAFGNGTLHSLSAEYAANPDWTQGFSVIRYARSGNFHVDQVLVHKPSVWSRHAEIIYGTEHVRVET